MTQKTERIVIYQVLVRLFGNYKTGEKLNGSIQENGVGKFNDFTPLALEKIKELGITHIWYTGVIEHASVTDYSDFGIPGGYAEIIKGIAGSPYAIRDYFDVHPDFAEEVNNRMNEFTALIERTHQAGMRVIIDFVPNHLSRDYHSDSMPSDFEDFGVHDDKTLSFSPQNDYYYLPGQTLVIPGKALETAAIIQNKEQKGWFHEHPARATGNDVFSSHPQITDWYETVKLNYGVDIHNDYRKQLAPTPPLWFKMLRVLQFWSAKGVDGFRVDMAEMIPVEFWQWVIPALRNEFPETLFVAEIYKPHQYKEFIHSGFDLLYDKKGFYETVRSVLENKQPAASISRIWQESNNQEDKMLRFLENHDEERIASQAFMRDPWHGIPGVLLALTMNRNSFMLYFGQEVGEPAQGESGFSGNDGKTTIFDYWHVPEHQKWMNKGLFDGALLSDSQRKLREQYQKMICLATKEKAVVEGSFYDLLWANQDKNWHKSGNGYAYLRYCDEQVLLFLVNFDPEKELHFDIRIPEHAMDIIQFSDNTTTSFQEIYPGKKKMEITSQILMNEGAEIECPPSSGKAFVLREIPKHMIS
jgi:glycosidase